MKRSASATRILFEGRRGREEERERRKDEERKEGEGQKGCEGKREGKRKERRVGKREKEGRRKRRKKERRQRRYMILLNASEHHYHMSPQPTLVPRLLAPVFSPEFTGQRAQIIPQDHPSS